MTTVSAIIPYYNGHEWLQDCVESVLNQRFDDVEVLIVDDCSPDDPEPIVDSIDDDRIRVLRHDENKGIPAARNTGIRHAKGEYIGFLDQDDRWHPRKLERQVTVFQEGPEELGVVYGDATEIGDPKTPSWACPLPTDPRQRVKDLFMRNGVITITALIKRKCFRTHGLLDESLYGADDYEFWLRIGEDYMFRYVPEIMAYKRIHDGNASNRSERMNRDKWKIARRYLERYPYLRPLGKKKRSQIAAVYASDYYDNGLYAKAFEYSVKSLWYQSTRPGSYLLTLKSLAGLGCQAGRKIGSVVRNT